MRLLNDLNEFDKCTVLYIKSYNSFHLNVKLDE